MNGRDRARVSVAVWVVGTVFVTGWGLMRNRSIEAPAVGYALPQDVAALETGRILEITVALHDHVEPGQVIAKLDPEPIVRERDVAAAQLLALQATLQNDVMVEARRFAQGSEQARLQEAQLRVALQEDRALLEAYDARALQLKGLVDKGAGSTWELEDIQREIKVVSERLQQEQNLLALASGAATEAEARNADRPQANEWELVAAERLVQQLDSRIGQFDLAARVAGQVVVVYRGAGDVVSAGDPVMRVVPETASQVVAYLAPVMVRRVELGSAARVVRPTGEVVEASVRSVGASPEVLPTHMWADSRAPEYGVPVLMQLEGVVAPGEPLKVRL